MESRRRSHHQKITEEDIAEYLVKKANRKLNQKFVWLKKIERQVSQGVPLHEFSINSEKKRRRDRTAEIEKVKRRREERAIEKSQRDEEMALLARERARAEIHGWERKEEEFDFNQSKIRSAIRLSEGRTKPIDVLTRHLDRSDDFETEPYMVFKGLTVEEMEELRDDIKMHLDFDRATTTRVQYWEALLVVCEWELARAREMIGEERGLHVSVETDVENVLRGKTCSELEELQSQIESQMQSGTAKVVEYWEAVVKRLYIFKAKACLKEIDAPIENKKIESSATIPVIDDDEEETVGSYSPQLLHDDGNEDAIDPDEDKAILERTRVAALDSQQVYWWHDKHRPRKPKYFNRVHTGYEWNKYNQTHYDHDNPPPKTVQGYKFDVFYPDLVDKSKAPNYSIENDEDSSETCIIRFHAGPPYEDVAFRIVNKEWEYSNKKGFKCAFERGILHVYFNFKRHRYRR